jgi:hypothetical protein
MLKAPERALPALPASHARESGSSLHHLTGPSGLNLPFLNGSVVCWWPSLPKSVRWWHRGRIVTVGGSSEAMFSENVFVVHTGPEKEDQVAG